AQVADDLADAIFRGPGQSDQDLRHPLLADQALQGAAIAQQWQSAQGLGQSSDAIIDEADQPRADIVLALHVFRQAQTVVGRTENDCALQELAGAYPAAKQLQQDDPLDAERKE